MRPCFSPTSRSRRCGVPDRRSRAALPATASPASATSPHLARPSLPAAAAAPACILHLSPAARTIAASLHIRGRGRSRRKPPLPATAPTGKASCRRCSRSMSGWRRACKGRICHHGGDCEAEDRRFPAACPFPTACRPARRAAALFAAAAALLAFQANRTAPLSPHRHRRRYARRRRRGRSSDPVRTRGRRGHRRSHADAAGGWRFARLTPCRSIRNHTGTMGSTMALSLRPIGILSTAAFCVAACLRITDPLLPDVARAFGVGIGAASVVVTAFAFAYGLAQVAYGPIGDRFGKYGVIAGAMTLSALFIAAAATAPTLLA